MIINFLQTRKPPILPSLQQQPNLRRKVVNGIDVTFDKDVQLYRGYGKNNKDSIGQLLFQFFRYYGHELDYEENVMSVRLGAVIPKTSKGWNLLQNNRLCVEEPFNTSRNLGNTADDTSMRGIHLEIQRAFKLVSVANLEECCEQYIHPSDEGKTFEKFIPPESRPVIPQAPPQPIRGGRAGGRGTRPNQGRGGNNPNRRVSGARVHPSLHQFPYQMTPQELQLHAQHQQFLLHDQLFQQYQMLQAQEQELRIQLHQQALLQGRVALPSPYPHATFPSYPASESSSDDSNRARVEPGNHSFTVPIRQNKFPLISPFPAFAVPRTQGPTTHPPSPSLRSAVPDLPRTSRHASLTDPFPASSLRAHSQPARPVPSPLSFHGTAPLRTDDGGTSQTSTLQHRPPSESPLSRDATPVPFENRKSRVSFPSFGDRRPEYIGYYVGHGPPLSIRSPTSYVFPVPSHSGLAIQNGGLSPQFFGPGSGYSPNVTSPPLDRLSTPRSASIAGNTGSSGSPPTEGTQQTSPQGKSKRSGPLVVNGDMGYQDKQVESQNFGPERSAGTAFSGSASDDLAFDTPESSETQSQGQPEASEIDATSRTAVARQLTADKPLHYSNSPAGEASAPTGSSKLKGFQVSSTPSTAARSKSLENEPPMDRSVPRLSPVKENTGPITSDDAQNSSRLPAQPNGTPKIKHSGKKEKSPVLGVESQPANAETASAKVQVSASAPAARELPNGTLANGGWQTQKKRRHKKAVKSESDINAVNANGGEYLPEDEALRKGG